MEKTVGTFEGLAKLKAADVMTFPVTTVHMWDSIHDVARLFTERNIGSAAVVDANDVPLGVITKSDLARYDRERATLITSVRETAPARAARTAEPMERTGYHLEPEEATIESWMTPAFFDVNPTTSLAEVVKKMVRNGLHHIFVTEGENKKIRGVITTFDLMLLLSRVLNP